MFNLSLPWWEFVVRGLAVYIFILVVLRIGGRKQVSQFSPFDFALLLIISNAVQNSMNGGDNSLLGGMIITVSLVAINALVNFVSFRSKKVSEVLEGKPEVLIHNGKLYEDILRREKISHEELKAILRNYGVLAVEDVRFAVIESTGVVSVIKK
ncbi:MAG: DUF421 domain-containing protein [Pseudobdellovibrio sp.]